MNEIPERKIDERIAAIEEFASNVAGQIKALPLTPEQRFNLVQAWSLYRNEVALILPIYEQEIDGWRKLLWLRHGCPSYALYGDDGEMQCNACMIDFKRMSREEIGSKWLPTEIHNFLEKIK